MTALDTDLAARLATIALGHVTREWPHKLDHILDGPGDARTPRDLHPIFFGSFDWHSCVHGWWQVLRLARRFPDLPVAAAIRARADAMLVPDKMAGELRALPYGPLQLAMIAAEVAASGFDSKGVRD